MVKFLVTDSLVKKVVETLDSLDVASIDSLPPKARLTFEKLSLRLTSCDLTKETDDEAEEHESTEGYRWVEHSSLFLLSAAAQDHPNRSNTAETCPGNTLFSLLKTSQLYFKPKPIREKSKELKAILENIQLEKDKQAYEEMISVKPNTRKDSLNLLETLRSPESESEKQEWKQIKKSITLIVNILFSVVGTIISIFWLLHNSYRYPFDFSILVSFALGLLIFFVELILYWNFL